MYRQIFFFYIKLNSLLSIIFFLIPYDYRYLRNFFVCIISCFIKKNFYILWSLFLFVDLFIFHCYFHIAASELLNKLEAEKSKEPCVAKKKVKLKETNKDTFFPVTKCEFFYFIWFLIIRNFIFFHNFDKLKELKNYLYWQRFQNRRIQMYIVH